VLVNEVREGLEKLYVPLNDSLLLFTVRLLLVLCVFLLEPLEDGIELSLFVQDLNDCLEEAAVHVLDDDLAPWIDPLGVLEPQYG
jgi:hypothetical protein